MNSQDKNIIPDINQLPTEVRAYWECIHALTNTYEYQKKSAQEKAIWIKKIEEEKIENLIANFLASMKEKEKLEILQEQIERHYNELKKIIEGSGDIILKPILDDQNWNDIKHLYDLLIIIKDCETQMILLWQRIVELDAKKEDLRQRVKEYSNRIEELDDEISDIRKREALLAEERQQIIDEALQNTGTVTKFDLSKLQCDDPRFMEILHRGIEIIDINHDKIKNKNKLRSDLTQNKIIDKSAFESTVNELSRLVISEMLDAQCADLMSSDEKREPLIKYLENCDYYKTQVIRISEEIMLEVGQEKSINALNENKVTGNKIKINKSDIINEKVEVARAKEKCGLAAEEVNSESDQAKEAFRKQAEKKEAALKRINQIKNAKRQLDHQPKLNTDINLQLVASSKIKDCESVVVSTPPTNETLYKLPITSNTAYVLCEKQLYFINKQTKECINLNMPEEAIEKIKKENIPFSLECQKLSESHIMKIGLILGTNINQDNKFDESTKRDKDKIQPIKMGQDSNNDSQIVESKVRRLV